MIIVIAWPERPTAVRTAPALPVPEGALPSTCRRVHLVSASMFEWIRLTPLALQPAEFMREIEGFLIFSSNGGEVVRLIATHSVSSESQHVSA